MRWVSSLICPRSTVLARFPYQFPSQGLTAVGVLSLSITSQTQELEIQSNIFLSLKYINLDFRIQQIYSANNFKVAPPISYLNRHYLV